MDSFRTLEQRLAMADDLQALSLAAVSIGFFHTLFGPDHYLPFVAMARVGGWSLPKTLAVTLVCGVAHVLSSVVLGCLGIALGVMVVKLEQIESIRGDLAGWMLLTFGVAYFVWGLAHALREGGHGHFHFHEEAGHGHLGAGEGSGGLARWTGAGRMAPWALFTIFLFGPCEVLIPMLMYPAWMGDGWGVARVSLLFGAATVATMLGVVLAMQWGASRIRLGRAERFGHALAGLVVVACGLAIKLGL